MATTIATLTEKTDGTLEGLFATIKVTPRSPSFRMARR